MKFKFEKDLDYQISAIEAVCDLFKGQDICRAEFSVSLRRGKAGQIGMSGVTDIGYGNRLKLLDDEILRNLQDIQIRNGLNPAKSLKSGDFTVEMETGTGKTYVYLRTIFELNKRFGFTKFVIVVPSVAIKEGVYKSLQMMESHFQTLYSNVRFDYFLYDSSKPQQVRSFATSPKIQIMVVTVGAINKKDVNNLYKDTEKTNGEIPIALIQETRPILIVDEPQSVDGGLKGEGKKALENMNSLCTLRYSATHADEHNMVYRLDAVDAYDRKLVKQIEVASMEVEGGHNRGYLKLLSVSNAGDGLSAQIEIDVQKGKNARREVKTIKRGSDLEQLTGLSSYSNWIIQTLNSKTGEEHIEISGLERPLYIDDSIGDVDEDTLKRLMIRRTIEEHLDKELRLKPRGIKVLSLFFVPSVSDYRIYTDSGAVRKGKLAVAFEEEYERIAARPKYRTLFKSVDLSSTVEEVHNGYFSIDKKGSWTETDDKTAANRENAERAYNLIMKEKEKLLSFDTKLKFIFSHSALREGWDNPNVFQICALRDIGSERQRRQTIGRGLRLCVNQDGERLRGFDVNTLTIIATEGYEEFAENLQQEIADASGIKFGLVEKHQFASIPITYSTGETKPLGVAESEKIWNFLFAEGYLDSKGRVQEKLKQSLKEGSLKLSEEFKEQESAIADTLKKVAGKLEIKNAGEKRIVKLKQAILDGEKFKSLWDRIKFKTTYKVDFDNERLIGDCTRAVRDCAPINKTFVRFRKADLSIGRGGISTERRSEGERIEVEEEEQDLPDLLSNLQNSTALTRKSLCRILIESGRLSDFRSNPQQFIEHASEAINRVKRFVLVDGIKYERIGDAAYFDQSLFESEELIGYLKNLLPVERSIYDYVVYDSMSVERTFAEDLERNDMVKLFTKLPSWFKIPTPLGTYNPDWAILIEENNEDRLYFVVETKASLFSQDLREKESGKIECGKAHFKALAISKNPARFIHARNVEDLMDRCASARRE